MSLGSKASVSSRHLLSLGLILTCLMGVILAQTFQYSRGWTNGKKRSSLIPFSFEDSGDESEGYGIGHLQRLKPSFQQRHRNEILLPYELLERIEDDLAKLRRKSEYETPSILDSLPVIQN